MKLRDMGWPDKMLGIPRPVKHICTIILSACLAFAATTLEPKPLGLTRGTALQAPIGEMSNNGRTVYVMGTREGNERDEIVRILKVTNGRVAGPDGAAARMNIKRTTLISRMKKLGIDPRKVS
jgi:transcriptional regulator with GAF, ATPase, and Fis domain